jgi:hypothetical protein
MPFWQQACAADKRGACDNLAFLQDGFCQDGSGWACNEFGIHMASRLTTRPRAPMAFERACALRFSAGCDNAVAAAGAGAFRHEPPTTGDYPFILRGSKGPVRDREPAELYARACSQGWPNTCGRQ